MRTPLFVPWLLALVVFAVADTAIGQPSRPAAPPVDHKAIELYIKLLTDADAMKRKTAAENLGRMREGGRDAVPALVVMLEQSTDVTEQMAAAMALAQMGEAAKPALPALRKVAAENPSDQVRTVAAIAVESITPPVTVQAWSFFSSTYGITITVIGSAALLALIVLVKRGRAAREEEKKEKSNRGSAPTARSASKPAAKPQPKPAPAPAPRPAVATQSARPAMATDRSGKPRQRVSRPLPGHAGYVRQQEGPESVKRDLNRAQEELKRISNVQKDLAGYLEHDDVKKDPERLRQLRKDIDEHGIEHFRAEVRVKALEVKMLEVLLNTSKATTQELRDRSEATLRQKWEELRTFCETPVKVLWKSDHWTHVSSGQKREIADLRSHLFEFDIVLPDYTIAETDVHEVGPSTPTTPFEPEVPIEIAAEPEEIELMEANTELEPEEIELIKAEAEMAASEAIAGEPPSNESTPDVEKADEPTSH